MLRIPGISARNVDRILKIRRHHRIRLADLAKLRVSVAKTRFVVTADHNPDASRIDAADLPQRVRPQNEQLQALFSRGGFVGDGEV